MSVAKRNLSAAVLAAFAGVGTLVAVASAPGPPPARLTELPPPPGVNPPPGDTNVTAFPGLKLPDEKEPDYLPALVKACPRVLGRDPVAAGPTDNAHRQLLVAQWNQGRVFLWRVRELVRIGRWSQETQVLKERCLDDMRAAAAELWADDPKELAGWLEELVLVARDHERFVATRVATGTDQPQLLNAARMIRLKAEAALWKARNGRKEPPAAGR